MKDNLLTTWKQIFREKHIIFFFEFSEGASVTKKLPA